jgi:tetratricopeptide (TPR) repeat protein
MKSYLTSSENIAFKRIERMMSLRKNGAALFLMSVDTLKLSNAFSKYFLALENVINFTPSSSNVLHELSTFSNDTFYYINLYEHENIEKLIKALQFGRDFISQYKLKVILLFDKKHYEKLQEEAYDFFSVNSYSYSFVDHSYDFSSADIKKSEELTSHIEKYELYVKEKNNLPKIEIELLFNIAKEAYAFSQIDLALEYYSKALLISQNESLLFEKSVLLGNIGLIYSDNGDLEEALKYHKEALEIDREIGYTQGVANQLGNIGLIYSDKGDLEEALKYLKEALEIFKEIGYKQGIDIVQSNIDKILEPKDE